MTKEVKRKDNEQPKKGYLKEKFIKETGTMDWEKILLHMYENKDNGMTMAEWAFDFGVHKVTLCNKFTGFMTNIKLMEEQGYSMGETMARREINIKKEQAKLALMRKEFYKDVRKQALTELIYDDYIKPDLKPIKIRKYKTNVEENNKEQLFFISDLHYHDSHLSESLSDITNMVIENWDGSSSVVLVFGGDYIENRHHVDQQIYVKSAIRQATEVADVIAEIISNLIANLGVKIKVAHIIGNHDTIRQGGEKSGENLNEHIVYIIANKLSTMFKGEELFEQLQDYGYQFDYNIAGKNINFRHGHIGRWTDKNVQKNILKEEEQLREKDPNFKGSDVYVFGHYHRWNDWFLKGTNKRFIIGPCMKTYDGNFENANVLRGTVGITKFNSNGDISIVRWNGTKKKHGDLK